MTRPAAVQKKSAATEKPALKDPGTSPTSANHPGVVTGSKRKPDAFFELPEPWTITAHERGAGDSHVGNFSYIFKAPDGAVFRSLKQARRAAYGCI